MNINELIVKKQEELTVTQLSFLECHQNIIASGNMIGNALIDLAQNLKRMKDEKLYVEAGFETFANYTETACNLKERQAYNYIKILDNFGEEFLHSNAKIGVSKLTLLSTLSEEEKIEVLENVNVEETSVAELKEEIAKIKADSTAEKEKSKKKIEQLRVEIDSLKKAPKEKEFISDPKQQEKIDNLEKIIKQHENTIASKNARLKELDAEKQLTSCNELTEFKFLFDEVQLIIEKMQKLIPAMPEEKQEGCKKALQKVGEMLC